MYRPKRGPKPCNAITQVCAQTKQAEPRFGDLNSQEEKGVSDVRVRTIIVYFPIIGNKKISNKLTYFNERVVIF